MRNKISFSKHSFPSIHYYCSSVLLQSVLDLCDVEINNNDYSTWDVDYSLFKEASNLENILKVMIAFNEFCGGSLLINGNLSSLAEVLIELKRMEIITEDTRSIILEMITAHRINETFPFFNEVEGFVIPETTNDVSLSPLPKFASAYISENVSCVLYYDKRRRGYFVGEYCNTYEEAKQRAKQLNEENAPE